MNVNIVNMSSNKLPDYQTDDSAGMDLMAHLTQPETLKPFERKLIPTGISVALASGTEAQVRPRSGLALKHGITVLNSPGTIDADYRGEIKVLLINLSDEEYTIQNGDRIAQMVVSSFIRVKWNQVDDLGVTERGTGGYGSTGY